MGFRFLALLLVFTPAGAYGQTGLFGPVSAHLKAGDPAPDIVFTKTLSAGGLSPWSQVYFNGRLTVIAFFPDTSHNLQTVSRWNTLVEQFEDKPVQFVWITAEEESSLLPWLKQHPVKGWVVRDPEGATGRAYGIELPAAVIIGNDRKIIGFDRMMVPEERTLSAALEGRIILGPAKPESRELKAIVENHMVLLDAEPPRIHRPEEYRPDFPPSSTVHVSPSTKNDGTGNFGGDDFWSLQGFELKGLISLLYDLNPARIELPASLDDGKRYDTALVLPGPKVEEEKTNRIRQGIEDYFHVAAISEERFLDVYVVSALNGNPLAVRNLKDDGPDVEGESTGSRMAYAEFSASSAQVGAGDPAAVPKTIGINNIRNISLDGTLDDFCRMLERLLDRPVVNEAKLEGMYSFRIRVSTENDNNFLDRVRDQLNLTITPAQRRVQILVLRPR